VKRNDSLFIYSVSNSKLIPIPEMYDGINMYNNMYKVEKDGKFGLISEDGTLILDCKYDNFEKLNNGLFRTSIRFISGDYEAMIGYKLGLVDSLGNKILANEYNEINDFHEGLAPVRVFTKLIDGLGYPEISKWGFINESGKIVIPLVYDNVSAFSLGKAKVEKDGDTFYINKRGERVEE